MSKRVVGIILVSVLGMVWGLSSFGQGFSYYQTNERLDLKDNNGKVWLSTVPMAYDPARRDETYRVYTQIYDFAGEGPITKGPGGKDPHHRGLYIGWETVTAHGKGYNLWEMTPNSSQRHTGWREFAVDGATALQSEDITWYDDEGAPLIKEIRTITACPGENGLRIIDFYSTLSSVAGPLTLRGNPHHGGMQVRMAQEVAEHRDSTQFILPKDAVQFKDDVVKGAWWACCSSVVRGQRYWLIHMTPTDISTGQPLYSIRPYGRFGAFFEPDLKEGQPRDFRFRVVVSDKELDRAACENLYRQYNP